ncbi:MAG: TetR/AcrR family transcriptional regulator [Saprospiraceae bacterium]
MPRTKEEFAAIRKESRRRIMEAALELFATRGFYSTSISQIAKTAEVSKGLMYNYFSSKEELLKAILMNAYEEGAKMMEDEMKLPSTPQEHILHIIDMFENMMKTRLKFFKLLTALMFQDDAQKLILSDIMPKKEVQIEQTIQLFEQAGYENPKTAAYYFGAVLDGIAIQYMTIGTDYPLDEMLQEVKNKYK